MTKSEPRLSAQTLKVLNAFLASPRDELSGSDIGSITKLASGTLYPILLRLEHAGWLESHWEKQTPQKLKRPRRRFYCITALGANNAMAVFQEFAPVYRRHAWA
jgi:DNA-binding PadR family transcriptional regulator